MGMPWRAVEAMHWNMGEEELARRAGVQAFSHRIPQQSQPQIPTLPGIRELGIDYDGSSLIRSMKWTQNHQYNADDPYLLRQR